MVEFEKMKVSSQSHDSDKDPSKTLQWLKGICAAVGTTPHGKIIYAFVVKKHNWQPFQHNTVSSNLINDPSFGSNTPNDGAKTNSGGERPAEPVKTLDGLFASPSGIQEALDAVAEVKDDAEASDESTYKSSFTENELLYDNWPHKPRGAFQA